MSFKQFSSALGISQLTPTYVIKQICFGAGGGAGGSLSYVDYITFWNSLQRTQSLATKMLGEVILKIVELQRATLKRLAKLKQGGGNNAAQQTVEELRTLWTLANIARFLYLYLAVESNNAVLRKAQKAYETHRAEFLDSEVYAQVLGEMDRHLALTFQGVFEDLASREDASPPLASLLDELVEMNTSAWALGDGTMERDLSFRVDCDFALPALRLASKLTQQQGGREAFAVFALLANRLHAQSVRAITPASLETLRVLLLLLHQAFSSFPVIDLAMSQQCEAIVRRFVQWPVPYGSSAGALVDLIRAERVSPGATLRRQIQREHPILTKFGQGMVERFQAQSTEWSHASRQVVVLHNNSARSNVLRKLISRPILKGRAWANEMQQVKEDFLVQIFECELMGGTDEAEWQAEVSSAIRNKPAPELNGIFDRVVLHRGANLVAIANSLGMKRVFARTKPVDGFDPATTITTAQSLEMPPPAPQFNPALWPQQQIRTPALSFDFLEMAPLMGARVRRAMTAHTEFADTAGPASLGGGKKKSVVAKERKPGRMSLAIPGLDMFAGLDEEYDGLGGSAGGTGTALQQQCPQQYVSYSADFDELVREARQLLPPGGVKSSEYVPVLRRVLLGGQDVLHRAVSTYCMLLAMDPDLAKQIKFEYYLVPTASRNDLACFLAQRDGWYRKQVFAPFCNHSLLHPAIKADKDDLIGLAGGGGGLGGKGASMISKSSAMYSGGGSFVGSKRGSLNQPPSAFDSDFQSGGETPYTNQQMDDVLDTLEEPGGFDRIQQQSGKGHKFDAIPGKLLRPILESYLRQATEVAPIRVFDCECWESIDSIETERSPDVTIPFVNRVELGLPCAVQQCNAVLQEEHEKNGEEDFAEQVLGLGDMLVDKTFLKSVAGGANAELKVNTPELTVHMYPIGLDGVLDDVRASPGLELADASYLSLTLANTPRFTWPDRAAGVDLETSEPLGTTANPTMPWIEVQCVANKTALVDLVRKREKKAKDLENVMDALRLDCKTHHAGFVDVRSTLSSRVPFFIAVDGQVFGPYYRVRVRRSTALSTSGGQGGMMEDDAPVVHFPLVTFLPISS